MLDMLLRGGTVVDGTGGPPRLADVAVKDGRIVEVGPVEAGAARVIDCAGCVVSPGFIDIHTHLDAQVLWDADLTPSSWYGVTTVVMGNCGFSIAPLPAAERETWIRTLTLVEAMSSSALREGITWTFESFGEYFQALEQRELAINVAGYVGHTPLRMAVLGADASRRESTPEEVRLLRRLLRESLEAGALGFSTSKAPSHIGADGRPVPSAFASNEEIYALADEMALAGRGVIQTIGGNGYGIPEFCEVARRSGRNVTWTALHAGLPEHRELALLKESQQAQDSGIPLIPQVGCLPITSQFTMDAPYWLKIVPAWAGIGDDLDRRRRVYADRAWRADALEQMTANREGRMFGTFPWQNIYINESASRPQWMGKSIAELAAGTGTSPVDVLTDVALDDDLRTRIDVHLYNSVDDEVAVLLQSKATILGLSDAGAHANQMCNAAFGPHLLGHWVRDRGDLSLEFAIRRLTGHIAEFLGLRDRGFLRNGCFADICVFDPATIAAGPAERLYDFPGGADRLVRHAQGIRHVLVNGVPIREDDNPTTARPGTVVRG